MSVEAEGGWVQVVPVVDASVRGLCCRFYPLHPKGCPNFGKRDTCPPKAPMIGELLDLSQPVFAVYNIFDFGGHVARMRDRHPDWSERQVRCVLYWQGTARKQLRVRLRKFCREHRGLKSIGCPEACGVNVTATMAAVGIHLEWPPETVAYQIALAGSRAKGAGE